MVAVVVKYLFQEPVIYLNKTELRMSGDTLKPTLNAELWREEKRKILTSLFKHCYVAGRLEKKRDVSAAISTPSPISWKSNLASPSSWYA